MITEDYVSFKISKLLKKKGFDLGCDMYYTKTGSVAYTQLKFNHNEVENRYSRPTLQMAMKWLREIYDLHIIAYPWRANKEERATHWCCQVYKSFNLFGYEKYTNETSKTYEQACEADIKYCLTNLI